MKANELRIGNKLLFLGDVVTFKNITEIREDGIFWIKTFEPKIESKNFHFKPIPLTEEWLLKFGFAKKLGNFELPNFRFHINKPMNFDGFIFCEGYSVITEKIQFVHQLQNLYFALTQTELHAN